MSSPASKSSSTELTATQTRGAGQDDYDLTIAESFDPAKHPFSVLSNVQEQCSATSVQVKQERTEGVSKYLRFCEFMICSEEKKKSDLSSMKKPELVLLAKTLALSTSGTKAELELRIHEHQLNAVSRDPSMSSAKVCTSLFSLALGTASTMSI